jgi:hypothetical protein
MLSNSLLLSKFASLFGGKHLKTNVKPTTHTHSNTHRGLLDMVCDWRPDWRYCFCDSTRSDCKFSFCFYQCCKSIYSVQPGYMGLVWVVLLVLKNISVRVDGRQYRPLLSHNNRLPMDGAVSVAVGSLNLLWGGVHQQLSHNRHFHEWCRVWWLLLVHFSLPRSLFHNVPKFSRLS